MLLTNKNPPVPLPPPPGPAGRKLRVRDGEKKPKPKQCVIHVQLTGTVHSEHRYHQTGVECGMWGVCETAQLETGSSMKKQDMWRSEGGLTSWDAAQDGRRRFQVGHRTHSRFNTVGARWRWELEEWRRGKEKHRAEMLRRGKSRAFQEWWEDKGRGRQGIPGMDGGEVDSSRAAFTVSSVTSSVSSTAWSSSSSSSAGASSSSTTSSPSPPPSSSSAACSASSWVWPLRSSTGTSLSGGEIRKKKKKECHSEHKSEKWKLNEELVVPGERIQALSVKIWNEFMI